jgi:hypothetical protein
MSLSLNCLIHGEDQEKMFTIEIEETKNVSILKKLIKEEKAPHLDHVAASDLDLWNVSMDPKRRESVYVTSCSILTILVCSQRAEIRDRCCCPTLMLVGGGPWLVVMVGLQLGLQISKA